MTKQRSDKRKHRQHVHQIRVAAPLLDGPRTLAEIIDLTYAYLKPLGLFKMNARQTRDQTTAVEETLTALISRGWVVHEEAHYTLTPQGREEVNQRLSELGETGASMRKLLDPETVSKVTTVVHWGLAAIKLPAALLSGSVGLLNDATDTLLDGLSSLLVYFGLRFDKERAVNIVLLILMLVTGVLTLYEAGRRLFVPFAPEADWFAFLAVLVSAIVCLGLWAYQRYVGLRSGTMALIIQSVDSRNHVIVAASVTAGLLAALLHFPLLDTLVGLSVALLILKSAVELAIETVRSLGEEEADLSRFQFGIAVQYDKFRQAQLRDWMLYLVHSQGIVSRDALLARAKQALDFNRVPAARAMGLAQDPSQDADDLITRSLEDLLQRGWLKGAVQLRLTDAGKKRLRRWR